MAAGTPRAIQGGIGRSTRLGAIVKGGVHLETLGRVETVVLDETDTLTFGRPDVRQLVPSAGTTGEDLPDVAAAAELRSEHPLGKAIVDYGRRRDRRIAEPTSFAYTPGRGITTKIRDTVRSRSAWMKPGADRPLYFSPL